MIKGVNFYYFLDNNIGIGLSERDEGVQHGDAEW